MTAPRRRLGGSCSNEIYASQEKALNLAFIKSASVIETSPREISITVSFKYLPIVLSAPLVVSCQSVESVAPYDRGYLAENGMQWESDSRDAKLTGHVYTSKEASSGGAGAAGGGCGCN